MVVEERMRLSKTMKWTFGIFAMILLALSISSLNMVEGYSAKKDAGTYAYETGDSFLQYSSLDPITAAAIKENPAGKMKEINKTVDGVNVTIRGKNAIDSEVKIVKTNKTKDNKKNDSIDIEIIPNSSTITNITIYNTTGDILIGLDDVPEELEKGFVEIYAIDPTSINFTNANVTVLAKGTELYKCKDWNFTGQDCMGEWIKLMNIIPGEEYSFTLTPEDPGFGEYNATDDADTFVYEYNPDSSYATNDYLRVLSYANRNIRSYLKFSLDNLMQGSNVTNASICMWYQNKEYGSSSRNISIYNVYNPDIIPASNLTWNNQFCGTAFDNSERCNLTSEDTEIVNTSIGRWVCWDAKEMVSQAYESSKNYLVVTFKDDQESSGSIEGEMFYSENYNNSDYRPYLNVGYTYPDYYTRTRFLRPSEKDSYVDAENAESNYGNASYLELDEDNGIYMSFEEVNFSRYQGASINNAMLYLYYYDGNDTNAFNASLYRITDSWDEGLIDNNGQPNTTEALATRSINGAYGWKGWNITSLVNGLLNGSYENYGIKLNVTGSNGSHAKKFYSSDYGERRFRPVIVFNYSVTGNFEIINETVKDAFGNEINATFEYYDNGTLAYQSEGGQENAVMAGTYDIKIIPDNGTISSITVEDMNISGDVSQIVDIQEGNDSQEFSFAVNPLVNETMTVVAQGTPLPEGSGMTKKLLKCADWNFTTSTCYGEWTTAGFIAADGTYTFTVQGTDPAYMEVNTTVFNLFNATDTQYTAYKQMKNETPEATQVQSEGITKSALTTYCWATKWIAPNSTERRQYNGTWNFSVYSSCDIAAGAAYLFAKILKYNGTEYNPANSTQNSVNIVSTSIVMYSWSSEIPYSSGVDIGPGERIGVQICMNVTDKSKVQFIYWGGASPSNVQPGNITTITIDEAPNTTLVSPSNGNTTTNSSINFTCNATDDYALRNITFYWNYSGTFVANGTVNVTGLSNATAFLRTGLNSGNLSWNCRACDSRGQCNFSDTNYSINVVVDNPPTSTLVSPANGTATPNTTINFTCNATDDIALRNITFYWNYSGSFIANGTNTITGLSNSTNFSRASLNNGYYIWNCRACDSTNQCTNGTSNYTLTIDNTNPSLQYNANTETGGSYISRNNIIVNATATDTNLANITIRLYNSTALLFANTSTASPNYRNYTGLSDGIYYFNATAFDNANNNNSTATRNATIDTIYPALTIGSPLNTTYNNRTQLVNITCTDTNKQSTWFYNGTANQTYTTPINITFEEGANTLYVYTNDTAGNINTTNVTFTTDTIAPGITIIRPQNATYGNTTQLVNISAIGAANVWYNWNGTNATYTGEHYVNFTEGTKTLYAYANDTAGNLNTTYVVFSINTSVPTITIISPLPAFYNNRTVLVNISSNGDSVWYNWNGTNTTYTGAVPITFNESTNTLTAYANNSIGLENYATVTFTTDTIYPAINTSETTPQPGSQYNQSQTINLAISTTENATVTANITWDATFQIIELAFNGTEWHFTANFTNTTYPGTYNITFNVTDPAGNSNTTTSNFTINDVTAPLIQNVTPAAGTQYNQTQAVFVSANITDPYYNSLNITIANVTWDATYQTIALAYNGTTGFYEGLFANTTALGRYNITINATDPSGNSNTTTTWFNVTPEPDTSPPVFVNLANQTILNNQSLNYTIIATDPSEIGCYAVNDTGNFSITCGGLLTNVTPLSITTYWLNISVNDTAGNNASGIIFVNVTNPPPASITGLQLVNRTNETLLWNWTNPTDWDFNGTLIYIDGANIANLSSLISQYNAAGLAPNTTHTITVHTIDTNGAINNTDVNNTATTMYAYPDIDNDNIGDYEDSLLGNESNVNATVITALNATVGGNSTYGTFDGVQEVIFYDGTTELMRFEHNFSASQIDMRNITIIRENVGLREYLIVNISAMLLPGEKEILYLPNDGFITFCAKDAEMGAAGDISTDCAGAGETSFDECIGNSTNTTKSTLTCAQTSGILAVSNMTYSGIQGIKPVPPTTTTTTLAAAAGGGGGGGVGFILAGTTTTSLACTEGWECTGYGECTEQGRRFRTCEDANNCGTYYDAPETEQACLYNATEAARRRAVVQEPKLRIGEYLKINLFVWIWNLIIVLLFLIILAAIFYVAIPTSKHERMYKPKGEGIIDQITRKYRIIVARRPRAAKPKPRIEKPAEKPRPIIAKPKITPTKPAEKPKIKIPEKRPIIWKRKEKEVKEEGIIEKVTGFIDKEISKIKEERKTEEHYKALFLEEKAFKQLGLERMKDNLKESRKELAEITKDKEKIEEQIKKAIKEEHEAFEEKIKALKKKDDIEKRKETLLRNYNRYGIEAPKEMQAQDAEKIKECEKDIKKADEKLAEARKTKQGIMQHRLVNYRLLEKGAEKVIEKEKIIQQHEKKEEVSKKEEEKTLKLIKETEEMRAEEARSKKIEEAILERMQREEKEWERRESERIEREEEQIKRSKAIKKAAEAEEELQKEAVIKAAEPEKIAEQDIEKEVQDIIEEIEEKAKPDRKIEIHELVKEVEEKRLEMPAAETAEKLKETQEKMAEDIQMIIDEKKAAEAAAKEKAAQAIEEMEQPIRKIEQELGIKETMPSKKNDDIRKMRIIEIINAIESTQSSLDTAKQAKSQKKKRIAGEAISAGRKALKSRQRGKETEITENDLDMAAEEIQITPKKISSITSKKDMLKKLKNIYKRF